MSKINSRKLKAKMSWYGDSVEDLAEYLGCCKSTLYNKIKNYKDADFERNEILAIVEKYKLTKEEMEEIFFANEVSLLDTYKSE